MQIIAVNNLCYLLCCKEITSNVILKDSCKLDDQHNERSTIERSLL